jgi:uncharacterized protein with PhoU and TrkA domain
VSGLARVAVPQRLRRAVPTSTERLLRRTFGFIATVVTALIVLVFGSLVVGDVLVVLAMAATGIFVGGFVLGSSLRRFHEEVERTIDRMVGDDSPASSRVEALHMIDHAHAWGAGSRELTVPAVSGGAGRTIAQLRLRELTGASVVRVTRGGMPTVAHTTPGPDFKFPSGDVVLLIGEDASLTRAEEILLGRDLGVDGGATEIRVPGGSRHAGAALRELGLGSDVQVLVVRRADKTLASSDDFILAEGDVLVVSGTDEAVRAAGETLLRDER